MFLIVTIDTEEDNWGEYQRDSYSVNNIERIPRLQEVFIRHGVRPTYLLTYPVATDTTAIEMLRSFHAAGLCEIGTHPHPWNTPPLEEARTPANSYIHHLPVDLQYRKLRTLHDTIERNFHLTPRVHRSGRWGFDHNIASHLIRLGYAVDSSLSPAIDWTEYGGPDYSRCDLRPFVYQKQPSGADAGGVLLEVPATVDFVQAPGTVGRAAYWTIRRRAPAAGKLLAALDRLRMINHVCLSPELHDASQMIRLTTALLKRDTPVVNMFFHSPSLLEGCSPFVRTSADANAFVDRIDRFLTLAHRLGLQPATMSELTAVSLGASTVQFLH